MADDDGRQGVSVRPLDAHLDLPRDLVPRARAAVAGRGVRLPATATAPAPGHAQGASEPALAPPTIVWRADAHRGHPPREALRAREGTPGTGAARSAARRARARDGQRRARRTGGLRVARAHDRGERRALAARADASA